MPNLILQVNHRTVLQGLKIALALKAFVVDHIDRNVVYQERWVKTTEGFEKAYIRYGSGQEQEALLWRTGDEFVATHVVLVEGTVYRGSRGNFFVVDENDKLTSY